MVARAHSAPLCALCGRGAHRDAHAPARRGSRAAGPAATASEGGFELNLDKELDVINKWERVNGLPRRLAFKRRCY